MLQSIRDRTHGWVAGIIISLVILSFALWGIHSYLEGAGSSDVVAKVNGSEITKRQLAAAYEPLRNQVQTNTDSGILPEKVETSLKQRALSALINVQILRQASVSQNYKITDLQVENYLERMQDFQVNGEFSVDRFKQLLANNSLSVGDFIKLIKTTLLIDQPKSGIVLTSFVLPNEITDDVALINQERDISYLILTRDSFLKDEIKISDDELAVYYQQHQDEFKTPEQVSIAYLELSPKDLVTGIQPTADELKNYYNDNLNSYTQPMQWKIQAILIPVAEKTTEIDIAAAKKKITELQQKIKSGADFGALARQYPAEMSDSEWLTLSKVPTDLQQTVSALTNKDQVSDVAKSSKGLVLLKVVDIKPAETQAFDQVKDKVAELLIKQKSQEKYADLKEKLANLTYEHPDTLDTAAAALGLTVKSSHEFTHDKAGSDISSNKKIRDIAFSQDVLNSQNNSDLIQVTPDSVVVLRIKTHAPASTLSLQTVKQQVFDKLKSEKAEQQASAAADEVKKKLADGASPDQIAQQYHSDWNKVGYIGRYSTKVDSAILYTAFRIQKPQVGSHQLYASVKVPTGYAVVASNAVRDGALKPGNQEEYDVFAEQIQNTQGMLEYKLYEQSLEKKAKVKLLGDYQNN
jgi:peptidyl-prolyl cis-trans isomerase D